MSDSFNLYHDLLELAPDVPEGSILSRTIYKDERLSMVLFSFATGEELSEHASTYPAVLHFVSGRARLTLGQDESVVEAGAWARMAPDLPHTIVAETPVVMLLLMLRS